MELKWKSMQAYQLIMQAVLIMAFHYVSHLARSTLRSCNPVTDRHCHWCLMRDRDRDGMSFTPRGPFGDIGSAARQSTEALQSSLFK